MEEGPAADAEGERRTHGERREKEGSRGHRACRRNCASEGEGGAGRRRKVNLKLVSYLPESGWHETQLWIPAEGWTGGPWP